MQRLAQINANDSRPEAVPPGTRGPRRGGSPALRSRTVAGLLVALSSGLFSLTPAHSQQRFQPPTTRYDEDGFLSQREAMVDLYIQSRGITSPEVLAAMRTVPRHLFVPEGAREDAYGGEAVSVDASYSVPEPYSVARMTELLALDGNERILEIGTGSGYHTAILARLGARVLSMEIVPERAETARARLQSLGYDNVEIHTGNGYEGLPDEGPFDAIVLTAAPEEIPEALISQLKPGGRMVAPVGGFLQELQLIEKSEDGEIRRRRIDVVRMRPMVDVTDERPRRPPR